MKNLITLTIAGLFLLASIPAFACDGHKTAKADDGETLMTSVDDGEKEADTSKAKKSKKDAKKQEDQKEEATEGEADGEA